MSIKDNLEKIKQFIGSEQSRPLYITLLMALVATSSFGLGRLSKIAQNEGPVRIEYMGSNPVANVYQSVFGAPKEGIGNSSTGAFVASKKGKKYYPVDCSAGSSLKDENKIFFNTEEEAQSAGYSLSSSC